MSAGDLDARIRAVLADVFGVDGERLGDGTRREELAEWDSIGHLQMVTALEEEFGVRFTMEEIGALDSVASVRNTVARHL